MTEIVILAEMETAGLEALRECRAKKMSQRDTVIQVYAAMRSVWLISVLPAQTEAVH